MRTVLVTGSASGLGKAVAHGLREKGQRVIGLDRHNAEIVADLGDAEGRDEAVAAVLDACGGVLDGVVSCAALGPYEEALPILRVNYFGAVAVLDRLRDALDLTLFSADCGRVNARGLLACRLLAGVPVVLIEPEPVSGSPRETDVQPAGMSGMVSLSVSTALTWPP